MIHGIFLEQESYAAAIADLGIRVTVDPRRLEPPCALVVPEVGQFQPNTLACDGLAPTNWAIWLLAGQPGGVDAMRQLSRMAGAVLKGMETSQASIELSSYTTDAGDPWPAMKISFITESSDWVGERDEETKDLGPQGAEEIDERMGQP